MLRKRQQRGFMWAAAIAFSFTAVLTWWKALESGDTGSELIAPVGFTAAALIWLVNVLVAYVAAKATTDAKTAEGNDR
jgi:hypothetical protein